MNPGQLKTLLASVASGATPPAEAELLVLDALRAHPFEDLGFARVDHHRAVRQGVPEVIFGLGKTPEHVAGIADAIARRGSTLIVTRATEHQFAAIEARGLGATFHPHAGLISRLQPDIVAGRGTILVVAAGTSDLRVAEEAAITAELLGNQVERLYDVGVAGLPRLLAARPRLAAARVIVVVAGMEGALPSVVAGLVAAPVVAVPTSVGYGASFGGLAALLGMLNSCAAGVTVVNIDNGFGAAVAASAITHA